MLLCWLPCVFVGGFGVYLWALVVVGMLGFLDWWLVFGVVC